MANRFLLDTDIIVEYLRDSEQAAEFIEGLQGELLLSAINVAELWSGAKGDEEQVLEQFLLAFRVVPVDDRLAKKGGTLRREYGPSHGTGLADALIAATSIHEDASLITFNARHYPMLEDLSVPYGK